MSQHPVGADAPGPVLHRRDAVGSTQDEAAAFLRAGEAPPFTLTARRQTAGRGRLGRAFASPDGASLSLTHVHRTAITPEARGWIPLAAGLAAVRALDAVVPVTGEDGVRVGLKWPNDLHTADGRKLGGILVEVRGAHDLLIGIGLNLRGPVLGADGAPVPGAAWLRGEGGIREEAGAPADGALREALEEALVAALRDELERLESTQGDGDDAGTRRRYTVSCLTLGRAVRVDPLGETGAGGAQSAPPALRGIARDIDGYGRLVLDPGTGERRTAVDVGDVRHLRPDAPSGTAHETTTAGENTAGENTAGPSAADSARPRAAAQDAAPPSNRREASRPQETSMEHEGRTR